MDEPYIRISERSFFSLIPLYVVCESRVYLPLYVLLTYVSMNLSICFVCMYVSVCVCCVLCTFERVSKWLKFAIVSVRTFCGRRVVILSLIYHWVFICTHRSMYLLFKCLMSAPHVLGNWTPRFLSWDKKIWCMGIIAAWEKRFNFVCNAMYGISVCQLFAYLACCVMVNEQTLY